LAEVEKDPTRKHAALDEALGLVEVYVEDETWPLRRKLPKARISGDLIRDASWRKLVKMKGVQINLWYKYMMLFLGPLKTEVDAIVAQDSS